MYTVYYFWIEIQMIISKFTIDILCYSQQTHLTQCTLFLKHQPTMLFNWSLVYSRPVGLSGCVNITAAMGVPAAAAAAAAASSAAE